MKCLTCVRFIEGDFSNDVGKLCPHWNDFEGRVILPKRHFTGEFCTNYIVKEN